MTASAPQSEPAAWVLLVETSANQRFIFATGRLREQVGASELIARVGTTWAAEAVADMLGPSDEAATALRAAADDPLALAEVLRDPSRSPRLAAGAPVEIAIATSGKVIVVARSAALCRSLTTTLTNRALREAPGLEVAGAHVPLSNHQPGTAGTAFQTVHAAHARARISAPAAALRFLRLPPIADCASSGLPAELLDTLAEGDDEQPISASVAARRAAQQRGLRRLRELVVGAGATAGATVAGAERERLAWTLDALDRALRSDNDDGSAAWMGIVHADGNGLGAIFQRIGNKRRTNDYLDAQRRFSLALDEIAARAFAGALDEVGAAAQSVVPIILGGDDLTFACRGKDAVPLTASYLRRFEQLTGGQAPGEDSRDVAVARRAAADVVPLLKEVLDVDRLSAAAGVAIVKPHHPFSAAYDLAEQLTRSAKQVKHHLAGTPCSALDFHVLFDSSSSALSVLRQGQTLAERDHATLLTRRPYVITPQEDLPTGAGGAWAARRGWEALVEGVQAVLSARLPATHAAALRTSVFGGRAAAEGRAALIPDRHRAALASVLGGTAVFAPDADTSEAESRVSTRLLDVLELADVGLPDQTSADR